MTYTNEGLVAHVQAAAKLKTKYMWGGILREITIPYIEQLRSMYGTKAGTGYSEARYKSLYTVAGRGYYGCDCVGLVKSYYWSGKQNGGTGSPKYDGKTDVNAGTMYAQAKVKGAISTIPERPGVIVISKTAGNHVGGYIGDGETIECTLGQRGDGIVKRKLDSLWTDWFECPYISYNRVDTVLKTVTLAYNAQIRRDPRYKSESLGLLTAGTKCVIYTNTKQTDPATKYEYIKLYGRDGWIVTSAIGK